MNTVTLHRPVGPREWARIVESDWRAFPPRLVGQPFFYPVVQLEYARKMARDWNVREVGWGLVTRFRVQAEFLKPYEEQTAGGRSHTEYWIPAERLPDFNAHLVGRIEALELFI